MKLKKFHFIQAFYKLEKDFLKQILIQFSWIILAFSSSTITHHELQIKDPFQKTYEWELEDIPFFNELIVSWNAFRPSQGFYLISTSLYTTQWSAWLPYAAWHKDKQKSFNVTDNASNISSFQDIVVCSNVFKAKKLRIRIEAIDHATLKDFFCLHACTTLGTPTFNKEASPMRVNPLNISPLSQMTLDHPRFASLCSPTSTTATIRYLTQTNTLQATHFAQHVYDQAFDIYGNWSFSVAQAFVELGKAWRGWVARFTSFNQIITQLKNNCPIVVSLKGPLKGSAQTYQSGHLVVIRGYHAQNREILCMDPAFSLDSDTLIAYEEENFLQAWERRGFVGYCFARH
ncbi:C39 family peptidase [Candidatus Protochlamydia amoebophila]|uniref:Peptidase C39-like domain-containing protein n=1 Tax=Candidatus Protochlamydia amoebophila TaxID=362787 RepID=A0A0C1JYL1_9BACT|nr:C39 family peptidase [Candidatus Protochlamydia amoebophila]KIC72282.1 hypothetical protein DB44_CL00040 [Candidatus Protochlamydia amoebophila]